VSGALRLDLVIAGLAFFLSGIAALVYQVAWQRILALHTGVGIYSIAVIVASFMAGLGAGSHLGGVLSTRRTPARALRAFAFLELGIAAFGAVSCSLYYDLLYARASWLYASPLRAGILHFLALLLPTTLMGMSLPFLVRGLLREANHAGRTVGYLYGVNTLGASLGALLTPWLLVPHVGIRGAVFAAVGGNLLAAASALVIARLVAVQAQKATGEPAALPAPAGEAPEPRPFALWMSLYALSGFCALSLEILWFRIVDVAVKSSAFTFGTVLALYLLGMGSGALLGAPRADRLKRPLLVFLGLQCSILVWSGTIVLLLARLPPDLPALDWLYGYWQTARGFRLGVASDPDAFFYLYGVFPAILFGPPTLLMGLSFPVLQRAVHDDPATGGRKVGFLQAANIAGCVAGSLLVGLVLLEGLGTTGTLRLLLACGLVFAATGFRHYGPRPALLALTAGLLLLLFGLPGQRPFWLRLHGQGEGSALVAEDATSVVAVTRREGGVWFVFVNGKSHSVLPYGGGEHTLLGAVPAVIHPDPRDVAIIGLGSGNTAWAAACRPQTQAVTVFEIAAPQLRLLRELDRREDLPRLRRFLEDPRIRVVVADGRNALERDDRLYDLIEADALWPLTAYSGNLYSEEFFSRCARRLKPGGVMCTWAPTTRVLDTFARVFPHVIDTGAILVGGRDPLPLDVEAWTSRVQSPGVLDYLGTSAARSVLKALRRAKPHYVGYLPPNRLNRDLFPRDEFTGPSE